MPLSRIGIRLGNLTTYLVRTVRYESRRMLVNSRASRLDQRVMLNSRCLIILYGLEQL